MQPYRLAPSIYSSGYLQEALPIMPVNASNLSAPKYGYDFVVSTTQASINSGLATFLAEGGQPVLYICFLVDPDTGNPTEAVSLDEVIKSSNGINPFDIPAGTDYTDPRIDPLTTALFCIGIKIQIGLPPGVFPKDLPPIVRLGASAYSVDFNLMCSQFTIIQNQPPAGWGKPGTWNVWTQTSGTPWIITSKVDLVMADLDNQLDTPYFNCHPDEKAALKRQLGNISATAFSLQQLMFDLDNASLQSLPKIEGIPPDSNAALVIQKSFIKTYSQAAKERGWPLLSVTATIQVPDPSQLQMTAFERQVSQFKDGNGAVIKNPTPEQVNVTTLDYLCAANSHSLPGTSSFGWNWVLPNDVDQFSGVIAINRNAIASFLLNQIIPTAKQGCVQVIPSATAHMLWVMGDVTIRATTGQQPQKAVVTESGEDVIRIEYKHQAKDEDWSGLSYCGAATTSTFVCDVKFKDDSIVITQHVRVSLWIGFDETSESLAAYDKTRTDSYSISISQNGGLQIVKIKSELQDDSEDPKAGGFVDFFTGIDSVVKDIQDALREINETNLKEVPFNQLQSFIFPGSRTFTFKSADFSNYQDLVCNITYVDPSQSKRLSLEAPRAKALSLPLAAGHSGMTLSSSTEMLQNYVQGEIESPTGKFEAVQTSDGRALLFTTDTSGVLRVLEEQSGKASAGWIVQDLSSALIAAQFSGASNIKVRTFDVGQSVLDGSIGLAMAVSDGNSDWLFISLVNSSSNTSWTTKPGWSRITFDAVGENPPSIAIKGVLFAETMGGRQYLMVDIDRPGSSSKNIARYQIDTARASGGYWKKQDVPVDIESGYYQSCVGQVNKGYVDGIYTAGHAGDAAQLAYSPIENVFGSGPPLPRRLALPGDQLPSAMAAARYTDSASPLYQSTDLYCVSGSTLYRFAADAQQDDAIAQALITSDVLLDTSQLYAMTYGGVTTLWGRDSSNVVYYVSCQTPQVSEPGSWSAVVPVLAGIERISPYTNMVDGGNTIFAAGGGKLKRLTQASRTNAKLWRSQDITIAAPPDLRPLSFNSYTTMIVVNDKDDLPAANTDLEISADSATPLYINGLYYVIGPNPVTVPSDGAGTLTIIEASDDLNAAVLTVAIPNDIISYVIDPKNYAFEKISRLDSEKALRDASYPTKITAGGTLGDTGDSPLISSDTSKEDLEVIAARMTNLKEIYAQVKPPATTPLRRLKQSHPGVVPATRYRASKPYRRGIIDEIAMAAGDLFQWLKSGIKAVIDIIRDAATDAWHFIAEIAGKVYRVVLDTVEAIVGALEWIFDVIKTAIEDLIEFIKFLFAWDDIKRTKNVLHNLAKLYLKNQVDSLGAIRQEFDNQIVEVEKTLSQWAGMGDWTPLGEGASKTPAGNAANPAGHQTSSSTLFGHHFRNNFKQVTVRETQATADVVQETIDVLLNAVSSEGQVLSSVYAKLYSLATSLPTLSVSDAIKQIAVILGEGMLSSVRVVVDALFEVLASLANTVMELLDTKLHIPVISDILKAIGVPSISFLDLFSWIAAVSFDVVYKIVYGQAPFPDINEVNSIIAANSWDELSGMFGGQSAKSLSISQEAAIAMPHNVSKIIHIAGHAAAGFSIFMGSFLVGFEAELPSEGNPFSKPAGILGVMAAGLQGAAEFLVPSDPVENTAVATVSKATTTAVIISKVLFWGPVQSKLAVSGSGFSALAAGDGRATGSIVDSILVIPALFVTGWHFYELGQKSASTEQGSAIVGEVSNLTAYASRISYSIAVNDAEPVSKQVAIATMLASRVATGGLQTAQAFLVD
ncbi:hypothetical protein HJFPF1_12228 [Paramyrothecium foliicola]|nr:hypothetical protein HJFPF1_12228 [Paramyrothecium foliicola]